VNLVVQGPGIEAAHAAEAIGTAARSAFRDIVDRSRTTMQFGPDGLVIDGRMTFKP